MKAAVVVLAVLLAGSALFGAARLFVPLGRNGVDGGTKPFLFPAADRARIDRLRDRLAAGLLTLRTSKGDFTSREDGGDVVPIERVEATAFAVAGFAVARRMGSSVPGLDDAIATAKSFLTRRRAPAGPRPDRGKRVSALSLATIALSIARDPADAAAIASAGEMLGYEVKFGSLPGGWVQGVTARAFAQLAEDGRGALLGDSPVAAFPSHREELGKRMYDSHVSQALVEEIQRAFGAGPSALADEVFPRVLADPPSWAGEQTDLYSWTLEAWLAARRPGAQAWFAAAVPAIEAGVDGRGVIPGVYSGSPVSRTSCALLILWEGSGKRPESAP